MSRKFHLLIADDLKEERKKYENIVKKHLPVAKPVYEASDADGALAYLADDKEINFLIADVFMPPYLDKKEKPFGGIYLIQEIVKRGLHTKRKKFQILLISNQADAEKYTHQWIADAPYVDTYTFVDKGDAEADEKMFIDKLVGATYGAVSKWARAPLKKGNIIGESNAIRKVHELVEKIAEKEVDILLCGETGTGKELFAQEIHNKSARNQKSLVPLNVSAIPDNFFESELFGHEKGAFTGADIAKDGLVEEADKSTLFLDEIDTLPLHHQPKFLRFLQDGEFRHLGATTFQKVDVRIIAATKENLLEQVEKGKFRKDLFYRLNVFPIELPALRERREDIPLLVVYFIKKFCKKHHCKDKRASTDVLALFNTYSFPGNVRQLENAIERAVLLADPGAILEQKDFPDILHGVAKGFSPVSGNLKDQVEALEKQLITEALTKTKNNQSQAAEILGLPPNTLGDKIKKYGLLDSK